LQILSHSYPSLSTDSAAGSFEIPC
jgi:hypothetical protein